MSFVQEEEYDLSDIILAKQMFPEHHVEVVVPVEKKEQTVTEEEIREKSIEEEINEANGEYKEFLRKYQEWRGKE